MTKVLLFHTDKEVELVNVKVKDGETIIGDKKFDLNESEPLLLKRKFGMTEPLYILKWDCIFPGKLKTKVVERKEELEKMKNIISGNPEKNVGKNVITTITFTRDAKNIPESLYKTEKLKILGGMLKIKKQLGFLPLFFGLFFGVVITFILFYFKLIRI